VANSAHKQRSQLLNSSSRMHRVAYRWWSCEG